MASCVNKNTEEFKALAEQSNLHPIVLAAKISLWQEKNGLDNFPTVADISISKPSKASEETLNVLKAAAQKMGIDVQSLDQYAKANPDIDVTNVNGVADLIKGVIAISQGKEDVALTEEIVHMATAILEQTNPKLITELISKINRFKIYDQTLQAYKGKKAYQLSDGKPDIRKIKKEAVDKLIAELIVNQSEGSVDFPELAEEETRSTIKQWWETILDYLRGVYKQSNIDIFNTTASKVLTGEVGGTVGDIKSKGVFYQLDDTVKGLIDNFYNKYIDVDSRMKLNPATATDTRHYTFDDVRVAQTVTDKVKGSKSKMVDRTPAQQVEDEQKRLFGDRGHAFIDNYISTNLIDKDGYRKEFTETPVSSELSDAIQKQLQEFCKELISSYPEGTRFLLERKAVNTAEKGMLASTIDFKAIFPVQKKDGSWDMKIDTLDWKFTSIDKTKDDDIPWYKRRDWIPQMGEYSKIDKQYGARPDQIGKARMIPFIVNYSNVIKGDAKSGLVPTTLEIGKLDSLTETNLYLLPVPTTAESTGNSEVDALVKSLNGYYDKLYKQDRSDEDKFEKDTRLNELSKSIRNLQVKLNFAPLSNVADTFFRSARKTVDEFEAMDLSTADAEEIKKKIKDLLEFSNSAEKFASMDEVFLTQYPRKDMTKENEKVLLELEHAARMAERMQDKILDLLRIYVVNLAVKQGIVSEENADSVLLPEIPISGFTKTWEEASKLSPKIIKLFANINMNAGSLVNVEYAKQMKGFGELLLPLEKEASARGKKAFDLIGNMSEKGLHLIKKLDKTFIEGIKKAKESKDRKFFIDNINLEEYNKLAADLIAKNTETINNTKYSLDEEENGRIKQYKISKLEQDLDITKPTFSGYMSYDFNKLFTQTLKEEKHYSKEFKELQKSEAAYNMWKYFTALNEKAKKLGYLEKEGSSFFPLIEATILQKFGQTSNVLTETMDVFKGLYTTKINEEQGLSKTDPETGEPIRTIPKYFTRTDKDVKQLSTDLNKIGAMWIKSLLDYEKAANLDDTFHAMMAVENAKGSLMLNERNEVIFDESDNPRVNKNENKNAAILKVMAEDALYNLGQDLGSLGNIGINMLSEKASKTEEGKSKFAVNTKKTLNNLDTYTRALAVGLKPLIATANWAGGQFQMYINAGGVYRGREFERNNARVSVGNISDIEKALLDLIVPLNENITDEERRKIAKKQGLIKSLSTWSFSDVMMVTNAFPEKKLQLANALSFIENSMVVNGKIVNIREYVRREDAKSKYEKDEAGNFVMSDAERKAVEKTFESRVKELKESDKSLLKLAKIENEEVVIDGISNEDLAKFRTAIVEYGRKLNGQMNTDNKAGYRRDAIFSSFMMFKTWMPKLVSERISGLDKNAQLEKWEYGRVRLMVKTIQQLGLKNITKIREITNGSEEGLRILDEMLEAKRQDHFRKTGQVLDITNEEFYDLVRQELSNEMKELGVLLSVLSIIFLARAAKPPEDATDLEKNRYKFYAKMINKISDEVTFYYDPTSFEGMTKGSVLPSLNLITKIQGVFGQVSGELGEDADKSHGMKAVFGMLPGLSQAQTEVLPYVNPELAKEWGIRVTDQSRL